MDIKVDAGKVTTVHLSGRIDVSNTERLKQTLDQVAASNPPEVVLDFKGVDFIGSSGIGKLLIFGKELVSKGGSVKAVNLSKEIKALFASAKLDKLFNI